MNVYYLLYLLLLSLQTSLIQFIFYSYINLFTNAIKAVNKDLCGISIRSAGMNLINCTKS